MTQRWRMKGKGLGRRLKGALQFRSMVQPVALFTLFISLLPLALSLGFVYRTARGLLKEELLKSYGLLRRQYASHVDYKIRLQRDGLVKLAGNSILQESLHAVQTGAFENAYVVGARISKEVGAYLRSGAIREVSNCMVYAQSEAHAVVGNKVAPVASIRLEGWYSYYQARQGDSFFVPGDGPVFSMLQDIWYVDERSFAATKVGFVKLDLDVKTLFDPLSGAPYDEYHYGVAVLDDRGTLLFSTLEGPLPEVSAIQSGETAVYAEDRIISAAFLDAYGLRIYLFFDIGRTEARLNRLIASSAPYPLLAVAAIVLFTMLYARRLRGRIQVLVDKMQKVEGGDLRVTETIPGRDELHLLDRSFNHMVDRLNLSIQENYVQELEAKEARFRNLQLQINPHFLYNTLETVASIAAVYGAQQICEIANRLGEIFRYSLGRNMGSHVPLRQELAHVQNYVFIQKARFGERLEVLYDVDEGLMDRPILRFILQPLVENAILHGLAEKSGKGTIEITAALREDALVITVEDDGVGMPEETLARLRRSIDQPEAAPEAGGIGLRNVHQRLRLAYGDAYGVEIESGRGGSRVGVVVPASASRDGTGASASRDGTAVPPACPPFGLGTRDGD